MNEEYVRGLVSVIVPTYSRAHMVTEAMDSVWAQTYRPIELIVVDDGSTDETPRVLAAWGTMHSGDALFALRTFRQENRGVSAARNLGLIESRGEFIQFLDSDDLLGRSKVERQVSLLRKTANVQAAIASECSFLCGQDGFVVLSAKKARPVVRCLSDAMRGWFVSSHAILWSRAAARTIGPWDEQLVASEDRDYAFRFLVQGGRMVSEPAAWVYFRRPGLLSENLTSGTSPKHGESWILMLDKLRAALDEQGLLEKYRSQLAWLYYKGTGHWARSYGDSRRKCLERFRELRTPSDKEGLRLVWRFVRSARGQLCQMQALQICYAWTRNFVKRRRAVATVGSAHELTWLHEDQTGAPGARAGSGFEAPRCSERASAAGPPG